jgi:hypothetical protein
VCKLGLRESRLAAAIVAGCGGSVLLLSLAGGASFLDTTVGLAVPFIAALVFGSVAARAASARSAWRRSCLVNGLLSGTVGVSFRTQDEPWSGGAGYMQDLDRAIGPLDHVFWALAARGHRLLRSRGGSARGQLLAAWAAAALRVIAW